MNISMYQASAPRFVNILTNLSAILDKAQAHVDARKIDPAALTTYRLFPDMHPMTRQVQIACDAAKGAVARLAGVESPKHEDTEQTLTELKARIAKTIEFIKSISAWLLAAAFLFPRHDRVQHPAPQRRGDRQNGLHWQFVRLVRLKKNQTRAVYLKEISK
jgi:hypothetical protein